MTYIQSILLQKPLELLTIPIFLASLVIGSFLNVVIYRISAQYNPGKYGGKLTVSEPKRSFCPECLETLKWYENIPLLSYLILRGKCGHCGVKISMQYPAVEAITAMLITFAWTHSNNIADFISKGILISVLIASTAIDIKTLKIPNRLTLGGTAALLLLSPLTADNYLEPLKQSFYGILTGAGVTFLAVELGKLLFGKKNIKLKNSQAFIWDGKNKAFTIQEEGKTLEESEVIKAEELFVREKDFIKITGKITEHLQVAGKNEERESETVILVGKNLPDHSITGWAKEICIPQEAMGMGDVKLMGLIGCALGAPAALTTLVWASIGGAAFGLTLRIIALAKKEEAPNLIAFGPWISGAAILVFLVK